MTRIAQRWGNFTDLSGFTPYDDVPGKYDKSNVSVIDGKLRFDTTADSGVGGWFGPKAASFGRYSIGIQVFGGAGTGAAIMLWPTSDVWSDGEVDAFEGDFDKPIGGFIHKMVPGREGEATEYKSAYRWGTRHRLQVEWRPSTLEFSIDGKRIYNHYTDIPQTAHRFTYQSAPKPGSQPGYALIDYFAYESF